MDGSDLKRRLTQILNEDSDSQWLDERTSFDFIYEAAIEFADRTHCLTDTQSITTVADQTGYNLEPDFLKLYLKDSRGELFVKYDDGNDTFLPWKDYEKIIYGNQTTSVSVPDSFAIVDADLPSQLTGTTTSAGAATGGKSALTDTSADFTDVEPGSVVHNTTDGSSGVVVAKTSTTVLQTALFGGTADDWSNNDTYIIQPQGRFKLVLDPPPSDSGDTVTVYYVQRPDPVYTDYDAYRFQTQYSQALAKYAFWLYKYRDKDPNFGDAMYKYWDREVRKAGYSLNQGLRPGQVKVNMMRRRK